MGMAVTQSQDIQSEFYQGNYELDCHIESRHSVYVLSVSYGHGCHIESIHSVHVLSVSYRLGCHILSQDIQFVFYQCLMGMAVTY